MSSVRGVMLTRLAVAALLVLTMHAATCIAIRWLAIADTDYPWNHTAQCRSVPGLLGAQIRFCRDALELMPVFAASARSTRRTCEKTFSNMRWNCSSVRQAPSFAPDLERGTRESAFVHALSAAATSYAVARACAAGDLNSCSCAPMPGVAPSPGFRWGGCGDNLRFGLLKGGLFADAALHVRRKGNSRGTKLMNLHNNLVGRTVRVAPEWFLGYSGQSIGKAMHTSQWFSRERSSTDKRRSLTVNANTASAPLPCHPSESQHQMLLQTVETKCKCHGISGSCSVRTCWKGASELATIAATLKMRYMSASKVVRRRVGSRKQFVPKDMDLRPIRKEELIYMAGSPDYCSHSAEMGSDGTQGRQCNRTSLGSDSCNLMCCGRGYNPYTEELLERCHCKYHWCCYVTCKKCRRTVERYVCK
uniref:Protein Wnt n=1 Tax=Eptatretus burgeri TaxID=7764 RepID=A0A8C4QFZ7_EPTBU